MFKYKNFLLVAATTCLFVQSSHSMELSRENNKKETNSNGEVEVTCREMVVYQPDENDRQSVGETCLPVPVVDSHFDWPPLEILSIDRDLAVNDDNEMEICQECELSGYNFCVVSQKFADLFHEMINDSSFYRNGSWREEFKALLLAGANPNTVCQKNYLWQRTALSHMCSKQDMEMVTFLLGLPNIDVKFSVVSPLFDTPLEIACKKRNYGLIDLLFEAGADSNDSGLISPLMSALSITNLVKDPIVVERLLKNGANPNKVTPAGDTPLFWTEGNVEIIQLLIAYGANVNYKTSNGDTVLHRADRDPYDKMTAVERAQFVSALMNGGANPFIKNDAGQTAFDCARSNEVKKALQDNDPSLRDFEIKTFVWPKIERSQSSTLHDHLRHREIGGSRRLGYR